MLQSKTPYYQTPWHKPKGLENFRGATFTLGPGHTLFFATKQSFICVEITPAGTAVVNLDHLHGVTMWREDNNLHCEPLPPTRPAKRNNRDTRD